MRARVGLLTAAFVAAMVSAGSTVAYTDLDQDQEVIDQFECFQADPASACPQVLAQTISVAATGQLTAVELPLNRPGEDWTLGFMGVQLRDGSPSGAVLGTSQSVYISDLPTDPDYGWVVFTFKATPVTVTAGQVLAITTLVSGTSPGNVPMIGWGRALTDEYAGGVAWAGDGQGTWNAWANGSDFAFSAFVMSAAPTCDALVAVGNGEASDGPLTVRPGDVLTLVLFDFPPNSDATWALVPEHGAVGGQTVTTDSYGDYWTRVVVEAGDVGNWRFNARGVELEGCEDTVALTVAADAPTPTPTPTPKATATPTATPTASIESSVKAATPLPSQASLPDTGANPPKHEGLGLGFGLLMAGSMSAWLLLARRRGRPGRAM